VDVILASVLVTTRNDADDGRDRLHHSPGEVGGAVVGYLENLRLQTESAGVVLAREEPARFVVEVTREEVADAAVDQTKHNRVAVDGVGGGVPLESLIAQTERIMADARPLGRISEELDRRLAADLDDQHPPDPC
jgi:hypothetical protein